jgi:Tol biopolymer transport system component
MASERWAEIERLYHAALAQDPGARAAFLRQACASDPALLRAVEALLVEPSGGTFLAAPAAALAPDLIPSEQTSVLTGRQLGVYQIRERLGVGGMGEVYRARDSRLGRDVAIKVLPRAFRDDPDRLARFDREARLLAALNHPHIATIHGIEEQDEVKALVMELVPGDTLAERIARTKQGGLPVTEALAIARQIADALDAAHEKGIVHRDLKPANIKITPEGLVKVLDFGLAKLQPAEGAPTGSEAPTATSDGTREGMIIGTAAYMSPEQARGQAVDKRTDIWAFGCVLYEMLTGRAAFARGTISDTIAAILEKDPDLRPLRDRVPARVLRVLQRCLSKDPQRRWHHIADVRIELEDAAGATAPAADVEQHKEGPGARGRVPWPRYALVGAAATVLAGIGVWMIGAREGVQPPAAISMSVLPERGTTFPATGPWPVISPDGRYLVFSGAPSGSEQRLWLRQLESSVARPLQGTEGAIRPFWSPDSRAIGFFANGQLLRVDVDTGVTRVIGEAPYSGGLSGSWGEDAIVFNGAGRLSRISPAGGEPEVLIRHSDQSEVLTPSFLPDGRRFLYLAGLQNEYRLCVSSLDSDERRCLDGIGTPAVYAPPGYLLFVRGEALVAQPFDLTRFEPSGEPIRVRDVLIRPNEVYEPPLFSASRTGVLAFHPGLRGDQLVWHDRAGTRLGPPLGPGGRPALSPDGTLLAVQRRDELRNTTDLWLYELQSGTDSRLTFDPGDEAWPAFSPDGQLVLYVASPDGGMRLRQKRVRGDAPDEALVPDTPGSNPHWSSDGRFVLFQRPGVESTFDLLAVRIGSNDPPLPVAQTEHGEREGRFSPDVRWVAYDSTETGRREVWVQPFPPTGARWQISRTGGVSPQWRADGKELFYVAGDGRLMAVPIEAGSAIKAGTTTPLFRTIYSGGVYANYAASSDGQRFVVPVPPALEDAAPITVVVNWTTRLAD